MSAKKTVGTTLALAALATALPAAAESTAERFARETARVYREQARYPEHSWVLAAGQEDPVRAKRTPNGVTARGQDGLTALSVWPAEVSFEAPGHVDLYASLARGARTLRAERVTGEVWDGNGNLVDKIVYTDDGQGADRTAGDRVYSARVSGLPTPNLAATYMVRVEAAAGSDVVHAVDGFLYSRPWARLTGAYRDRPDAGNVVVSVEVEVERAGRFHLAGTLASLAGEPLGVAQNGVQLGAGRHWIDLSFYGLMFHDRGAAGPYRLASLALTTTGEMPNAMSALARDLHVTRAYNLAELRSTSFERADLLEAAARSEAEFAQSGAAAQEDAKQ